MFMFSTSLYGNRFTGCSYRGLPSIIIIIIIIITKFFISNVQSQQSHRQLQVARERNTQLQAARERNTQFMNNTQKHFNTQKTDYTKSHLKTALIIL
jgi:uncharacterized protein YpmS